MKTARTVRAEVRTELIQVREPAGQAIIPAVPIIESTIEKFLLSLDTKQTTKDAYEKALKIFSKWIKENCPASPTRENILEYKNYLQGRGLSSLTVNAYLTPMKLFFTYLEAEKIYPNIARGIKGLKKHRGNLKDTLTKAEASRLLDSIKEDGTNTLRDYAIINLILRTGLRTIEVIRADIKDIGREGGETVLRVWGKGRDTKDDFVILTDDAYRPILDYLQARGETKSDAPLFASTSNRSRVNPLTTRSIRRIIADRLKAVGLKTDKITAHSLRHTAGTIALINGADLLSVKEMLRHADINTTLIYVHNLNRLTKGAEKFINFN